jgi:Uma2 family endonuclease
MVFPAPPVAPPHEPETFDFEAFTQLPENIGRDFELIAGEVVEKMVSRPRQSIIAVRLSFYVNAFVIPRKLGRVSGADGGYWVGKERYIPDMAFISNARQSALPNDAYNPLPPDLAVEVISPSNDREDIQIKVGNYLAAGTVAWVVDVDRQRVEVYQPGQVPVILNLNETLEGGAVLPGFTLALHDLFAD